MKVRVLCGCVCWKESFDFIGSTKKQALLQAERFIKGWVMKLNQAPVCREVAAKALNAM
ncbi:hypothetical protein L0337_19790 [candidate division KSB1 bacterium]|nr:hypothetical protein [candidate division KSB1 bacterium]